MARWPNPLSKSAREQARKKKKIVKKRIRDEVIGVGQKVEREEDEGSKNIMFPTARGVVYFTIWRAIWHLAWNIIHADSCVYTWQGWDECIWASTRANLQSFYNANAFWCRVSERIETIRRRLRKYNGRGKFDALFHFFQSPPK